MEYEQSKFTKKQIVDLLSVYQGIDAEKVEGTIFLLEQIGIIPEYVFREELKLAVKKADK